VVCLNPALAAKASVVVAARALEAGTKLSLADVKVVQVHAGAALEGAFASVEDVTGLVITIQRMPGDQVTADMVGDAAQNALAQALDPDHRAVAHSRRRGIRPGRAASSRRPCVGHRHYRPVMPITLTWHISNAVPAETTTTKSAAPKVGASGTTTEAVFTSGSTATQPEPAVDPNPAVRVSPVEPLTMLDTQV
jgi:hypothetical protein